MTFQKILGEWQAPGQVAKARRAARVSSSFDGPVHPLDNPTQVCKNLEDDRHIKDSTREALLRVASRCKEPENALQITTAYERFCRRRQQEGPVKQLDSGVLLGNTMKREKLEDRYGSSRNTRLGLSLGKGLKPRATVDQILSPTTGLTEQQMLLGTLPFSPNQMWSFLDPKSPMAPFGSLGRNAREIRRRLGLGLLPENPRLVLLTFRLPPDLRAHEPTAFDAGMIPFFRPGGQTCPLSEPATDGFPEVVHDPITPAELASRIEAT
jgi:hypothetical protein